VLRPSDRVGERACPLATGVLAQLLGDVEEVALGAAAGVGDELRRVARVVALEDLEDAARMLERLVFGGRLAVRETASLPAVPACSPLGGPPPEPLASIPSYCQVSLEYFFFFGSQPEKSPSPSSASSKRSSMITAAFV